MPSYTIGWNFSLLIINPQKLIFPRRRYFILYRKKSKFYIRVILTRNPQRFYSWEPLVASLRTATLRWAHTSSRGKNVAASFCVSETKGHVAWMELTRGSAILQRTATGALKNWDKDLLDLNNVLCFINATSAHFSRIWLSTENG